MEMEDHSNHSQYGIVNLRQFISGRVTHFPSIPQAQPAELFSAAVHRSLQPPHHQLQGHHPHYDMMMLMPPATSGGGLHEFHSDSSTTSACVAAAAAVATSAAATNSGNATVGASVTAALGGLDNEAGAFGGDGGTGRWPRQETLTLLEIRSRLDSKFKEANQKGPLWDEVSRILSEEHGYQRSGKKCREKFENLYKYYKKTKEGKAGRQDGKHYRFFRQLEALYGETSNQATIQETHFSGNILGFHSATNTSSHVNQEALKSQKLCGSLSLSNSSDFNTSSSEDNDLSTATLADNDSTEKRIKRRGGKGWKAKVKDFIDSQMRKLVERQEIWLEKLTRTLEQKEQERMFREEEWRKEETARIDREHQFWAKERAWMEARDAALMEALKKLTGREVNASPPEGLMLAEIQKQGENQTENGIETVSNYVKGESWPESEIIRLFQLRTGMETRFQQSMCAEGVLWEEIAAKMACLGYDRDALICKDKWDSINQYLSKTKSNKKRKENSRSSCLFQTNESMYNPGYCDINEQEPEALRLQSSDGSSPASSNAVNTVNDSCFRFLMSDGENFWENYGLKLKKGDQSQ